MLPDPSTLVVAGAQVPGARTAQSVGTATYTAPDGVHQMSIKQTTSKSRFRREVRFSTTKVAADPISAVNVSVGASAYIVIDEPRFGFSDAELVDLVNSLVSVFGVSLNPGTETTLLKVLNGEY